MTATRPTDLFVMQRYDDAPAAFDWLERAFGFEHDTVVPGEDGSIAFATLRLGDDLIGSGTARPDTRNTVCVYVEDPDGHCERARAAGAVITQEPETQPYGGRIYVCKDLDGHDWSFGTTVMDKPVGCDIAPVIGYRNPESAIEFLKTAFGFEESLLVRDGDGGLVHVELRLGHGIVMPTHSAKAGDNSWAHVDFGLSVYVADPDAHYGRAMAAGAEIVRDLKSEDYGARGYSARDIEGNLWGFSDYRPEGSRP